MTSAVVSSSAVAVKRGIAMKRETRGIGGIDLSRVELSLQDEVISFSLSSAERKLYQAELALRKYKFPALALLKIHELMSLTEDGLANNIKERWLFFNLLKDLQKQQFLDPYAFHFFQLIQRQKPTAEIKLALFAKSSLFGQ